MLIIVITILFTLFVIIIVLPCKLRTLAILTFNGMIFCFIINLSYYLFLTPKSYKLFESFNLDISKLLISVNTNFELGNTVFCLDNVSSLFILLVTLLTPLALLSNWNSIVIFNSQKLFFSLLIWIEIMLIIAFSTLDLFIFYLSFEALSMPVFFLIFLYGAEITKIRASWYFIIYSLLSSTCMALSIFLLYSQFKTTNILQLLTKFNPLVCNEKAFNFINIGQSIMSFERLSLIWLLLFLGFIIKIPMVPFHMWLPEAHAEAPTSGSILLTGAILKLGGYGLYRFHIPLFGKFTYFLPLVHTLAIIGIIYIGLTCLQVNHIKQIIAYSSIIHMNAVCLGLFTNQLISISGAIYAMLSHSLISSYFFMLAGILYTKYESYYTENYSGLSQNMPYFCYFFIFIIFANIAIPLTSGFIGEVFILIDLSKDNLFIFLTFFINYLLNTGYSIWLVNKICFGDINLNRNSQNNPKWVNYLDLNNLEISILTLLAVFIVYFGIYPNTILPFK